MADNTYLATATAYDVAGNSASATQNITVDGTAPIVGPGATDLNIVSINIDSAGASASDFITNDRTLLINGSFNAADTNVLTVNFNGTTYTLGVDTATDRTVGNVWTLDVTGTSLADNTYLATATAYDVAGNSASATQNITVDGTAPIVGPGATDLNIVSITIDSAGASASDFITNDRTLLINGSFNAADTNVLTVNFNGTTYTLGVDTATDRTVGNVWTLDVTGTSLADNTYLATATAYDVAGNSASATQNITVDGTAPTVGPGATDLNIVSITIDSAGASASDFITNDRTLLINGSFNAADTNVLTVNFNGTTYTLGADTATDRHRRQRLDPGRHRHLLGGQHLSGHRHSL